MAHHLPKEVYQKIYETIRHFLKFNDLKTSDLAGALGVSEQVIFNMAYRPFTVKRSAQWAEAFKNLGFPINQAFLMSGTGPLAVIPEQDPFRYVNYKDDLPEYNENESQVLEDEFNENTDFTVRAMCKIIRLRRERDEIYEQYLNVLKENQELKRKIAKVIDMLT